MERLWKLSLAVLLLGNAVDGFATYLEVQRVGIGEWELNPFARWTMQHLGPLPDLVLIKIIFCSALLLVAAYYGRRFLIKDLGRWTGTGFISILNLCFGINFVLSGTAWWARILPNKIVALVVHLPNDLVGWTLIAAGNSLFIVFPSCVMLPVLLLLDVRRRQASEL